MAAASRRSNPGNAVLDDVEYARRACRLSALPEQRALSDTGCVQPLPNSSPGKRTGILPTRSPPATSSSATASISAHWRRCRRRCRRSSRRFPALRKAYFVKAGEADAGARLLRPGLHCRRLPAVAQEDSSQILRRIEETVQFANGTMIIGVEGENSALGLRFRWMCGSRIDRSADGGRAMNLGRNWVVTDFRSNSDRISSRRLRSAPVFALRHSWSSYRSRACRSPAWKDADRR
jgi:hypothetical protein